MTDPINPTPEELFPTPEELLLHQALMKAWYEMWSKGTTDVDLLGINPKEAAR